MAASIKYKNSRFNLVKCIFTGLVVGVINTRCAELANLKISRLQELEADEFSFKNGHAKAYKIYRESMQDRKKALLEDVAEKSPVRAAWLRFKGLPIFSTHPSDAQRIAAAEKYIREHENKP